MAEERNQNQEQNRNQGGGQSGAQAKLNLNDASRDEIVNAIGGVGQETAETIINYREKNGRIENFEDLSKIKGIDDTMIDKIRNGARL